MASQEQTSPSSPSPDKVSISLTTDEESFTPFSDSEESLSSSKSQDHSPRNLTLEQFTDIVLAQEKLEGPAEEETRREKNILKSRAPGRTGAAGAKLKPVVLTPRQSHPGLPLQDRRVRDHMRNKLEFVIRKNEEILENNEALKQVAIRKREKPQMASMPSLPSQPAAPPALPLNLSVRKDLLRADLAEPEVGSTSPKPNISVTLEKLLARHGGDLEITRKKKKDKISCVVPDSPPVVNMTPLYPRPALSDNQLRGTKRLISPICNNNSEESPVKENAKKLKVDTANAIPKIADIVKKESAFDNPENSEKIKKIVSDFRIALQEDLHGNFPLHNAVLLANSKLVTRYCTVLLALGKSVDIWNKQGLTPLHIAVNKNQPSLVTELLKSGAEPGKKSGAGETCYHLAVRNNTVDCLALLLKFSPSHAEVNIFNDKGQTPLHMAVLTGTQALVKTLVAYGVNPDVQEARCGKTGLFLAVETGHQAIAELLLCYGASLTTSTYSGATPASLASEHNRN